MNTNYTYGLAHKRVSNLILVEMSTHSIDNETMKLYSGIMVKNISIWSLVSMSTRI